MKRFKELNPPQKKKAIDYMFRRGMNSINHLGAGQTDRVKARIKEITERIKFCGCGTCEYNFGMEISKDNAIKESILEQAQVAAEAAYYPEDDDTIIKV